MHGDLIVDGQTLSLRSSMPLVWIVRNDGHWWEVSRPDLFIREENLKNDLEVSEPYDVRDAGPLSRILSYGSPTTLVVPSTSNEGGPFPYLFDAALRLAHNLLTYLNIDCNIVLDSEIIADFESHSGKTSNRSVIVLGGSSQNSFAAQQLNDSRFPIQFMPRVEGGFIIQRRTFTAKGIGKCCYFGALILVHGLKFGILRQKGLIFMKERMMFICGNDAEGFERALRAFPLRTGVPNPEWLVLGPDTDRRSTGGILGAG